MAEEEEQSLVGVHRILVPCSRAIGRFNRIIISMKLELMLTRGKLGWLLPPPPIITYMSHLQEDLDRTVQSVVGPGNAHVQCLLNHAT